MKTIKIMVVRVYVTEAAHLTQKIVTHLIHELHLKGATVLRAVEGFGASGMHTNSLMDLSLSLPIIIEFFDTPDKIEPALAYINTLIKPEHVTFWEAQTIAGSDPVDP